MPVCWGGGGVMTLIRLIIRVFFDTETHVCGAGSPLRRSYSARKCPRAFWVAPGNKQARRGDLWCCLQVWRFIFMERDGLRPFRAKCTKPRDEGMKVGDWYAIKVLKKGVHFVQGWPRLIPKTFFSPMFWQRNFFQKRCSPPPEAVQIPGKSREFFSGSLNFVPKLCFLGGEYLDQAFWDF